MSHDHQTGDKKSLKYLLFLSLGALGVVYGDIGTSPLYALRECFHGPHAIEVSPLNVLGVLSLVFWSLILVISIKYLILIMRADNDGEGGILALMELVRSDKKSFGTFFIIAIGLFGAALLYGDGIITPAISVLSAVEGLGIVTPFFNDYILPITLGVLFVLFFVQKKGTRGVGTVFGPIMILWFSSLALLGVGSAVHNPEVFASINPYYAVKFFTENGFHGFVILGSVFLVVTGGEAIYADMGHFGKKPIRLAWFIFVLPSLMLNYFGQGALLLRDTSKANHPFYNLAPEWALLPMVVLSTFATVIASQAVISGAYSLTFQALQLGYLPRMEIQHTSKEERGQIYIPQLNWLMFIAVVALVLSFKTSSNLAAAYGIAVTSTMVITTILAYVAMRKLWGWNKMLAVIVALFFLVIDVSFFGANLLKLLQGGWLPLLLGAFIYLMMTTWHKGRAIVKAEVKKQTQALENFISEFLTIRQFTIPGTAIYMTRFPKGVPPAIIHNIRHNKILHKQIIMLSILYDKVPFIRSENRIEIHEEAEGFYRVIAKYGFMDATNISDIIRTLQEKGMKINMDNTTFFLGKETIIVTDKPNMSKWRERLFVLMTRNEQRATDFFNIPADRVFEIGTQVEI
jgi:KUP system potassium uptake protein